MKFGWLAKIVLTDSVILTLLYWILADEAARASYAVHEGASFNVARSILLQTSTLSGRVGPLLSPITLDWVQLLIALMVALDAVFVYGALAGRRQPAASAY